MTAASTDQQYRASPLNGQVAIITGASSGIGRATCLAVATAGASVVVVGRTQSHVDETLAELADQRPRFGASSAVGLALDVSQESDMREMARQTLERFGRIDVLVTCAGIAGHLASERLLPYPVTQLPVDEWDAIMNTNVRGVFLSNRVVLPSMISQRRGDIVNISSSPGGIRGQPFAPAYCASKFAVNGLSEALAAEVQSLGIRVQVLFPGLTDTPMIQQSTLTPRFGKPMPAQRIANLVVHVVCLPRDTVYIASPRYGFSILQHSLSDVGEHGHDDT